MANVSIKIEMEAYELFSPIPETMEMKLQWMNTLDNGVLIKLWTTGIGDPVLEFEGRFIIMDLNHFPEKVVEAFRGQESKREYTVGGEK